jgi:tetratricopeptide (TPR) repeat protein
MCKKLLVLKVLLLSVIPASADWNAGVDAYNRKDWNTALKEFQAVLETNPNYHGAHYMLGLVLKQLGRGDEAIKQLQEANRLEPLNPSYAAALGGMLLERDRPREAWAVLEPVKTAALRGAQKTAVLVLQCRARAEMGDFPQATELCRQATQADAKSADAWATFGGVLSRQEKNSDAFQAYRKAWEVSSDPNHANNAIAAGTRAARLASGDAKKALYQQVAEVAKQLAEKRGGPQGALAAGEALMGAQQYDEALAWFDRTGLDNALVSYYKGQCFLGKESWARAESLLRAALQKQPDAALRRQIYASLGFLLDKTQRYADAALAYHEAGQANKVAEMKDKQAKAEQNLKADEEKKRIEEMERLRKEYEKLTRGGGATVTPPPLTP